MPSGDLPATKFILFLQNHDQTGNRAFGERLLALANPKAVKAAYALLLLSPMIPMIFMGEEWGCITPFYFFCDFHGDLAEQIKEGRQNEFSQFSAFQNEEDRKRIPDPNALSTFEASRPDRSLRDTDWGKEWLSVTHHLLELRKKWIIPYLHYVQSAGVKILGVGAICAHWYLSDKKLLTIFINISDENYKITEPHGVLFAIPDTREAGTLPAFSFVVSMESRS